MKDLDAHIARVGAIDAELDARVQKALEHAAGSAFTTTKFNVAKVIEEQERKLLEAGKYGAALIGNMLNSKAALIATTADHAKRGRLRFLVLVFGVALAASALGGFVGTRMALP